MPIELKVALVTGVLGCFGILITAVFQYMGNMKRKKSEAEAAAEKALNEANEKIRQKDQEARDKEVERQIGEIAATGKDTQQAIIELANQVERMKHYVNVKLNDSEESLRMISGILSKEAMTRSNIIHMSARTEAQLKTLMEIESYNLKFTKETAGTLSVIGGLLANLLTESDDLQRLHKTLEENDDMQAELLDDMIEAQKKFFEQSHSEPVSNKELEAEIDKIYGIGKHKTSYTNHKTDGDDHDSIDMEGDFKL